MDSNIHVKILFLQLRKKEVSCMQALAEELKKRETEREALFRKKVPPLCLNYKTFSEYLKDNVWPHLLLI